MLPLRNTGCLSTISFHCELILRTMRDWTELELFSHLPSPVPQWDQPEVCIVLPGQPSEPLSLSLQLKDRDIVRQLPLSAPNKNRPALCSGNQEKEKEKKIPVPCLPQCFNLPFQQKAPFYGEGQLLQVQLDQSGPAYLETNPGIPCSTPTG